MDVYCANCGEPVEAYYLRHDLLGDATDLPAEETSRPLTLTPRTRKALMFAGWEFGDSVLDVRHCSACRWHARQGHAVGDARPGILARMVEREMLTDLLGDDEDALAVALSDAGDY